MKPSGYASFLHLASGEALELDAIQTASLLERAARQMRAEPTRHGWRFAGAITAFWNEDGFVETNALAACLDGDDWRDLKPKLSKQGVGSFCELAEEAYLKMAEETASGERKPVDPQVKEVLSALIERGAEIVVVSNSGTERVCQLLAGVGLDPVAHLDSGKSPLRVRGHAGKYRLGTSPQMLRVGALLHQRRSARLPGDSARGKTGCRDRRCFLAGSGPSPCAGPPRISRVCRHPSFLRKRPYTPGWALDYLAIFLTASSLGGDLATRSCESKSGGHGGFVWHPRQTRSDIGIYLGPFAESESQKWVRPFTRVLFASAGR